MDYPAYQVWQVVFQRVAPFLAKLNVSLKWHDGVWTEMPLIATVGGAVTYHSSRKRLPCQLAVVFPFAITNTQDASDMWILYNPVENSPNNQGTFGRSQAAASKLGLQQLTKGNSTLIREKAFTCCHG